MTANDNLMAGLESALEAEGQATTDATPMVAQPETAEDLRAELARLTAESAANKLLLAELEAQNAKVKADLEKAKAQPAQAPASNSHLKGKSISEIVAAISGHPVQVILRTIDPETKAAIEIEVPCKQKHLSKYGDEDKGTHRPGMSLQSSDVIMPLPTFGATRMFFQGKLIIEHLGGK